MKQQKLFEDEQLLVHGGELAIRRRKALRPLDSKRSVHCTLKTQRADLRLREAWIETEAWRAARLFHVKVYGVAVNDDHLHLLVKAPGRRLWRAFLRMFTSSLAREFGPGLFALLPFTRIVNWGKDFAGVLAYLRKNREEARGKRPYQKRRDAYARWRFSGYWTSGAPGG